MKYAGGIEPQAMPISVDAGGPFDARWLEHVIERFHAAHEERFNYAVPAYPVEVESVRVEGIGKIDATAIRAPEGAPPGPPETRLVFFPDEGHAVETAILQRSSLAVGVPIAGPAIVEQFDSTTAIPPGMSAVVDEQGNIRIRTQSS
jgi:N-methylhydantoinase A/oxoprolinase/acetone carboxylase beta subunit